MSNSGWDIAMQRINNEFCPGVHLRVGPCELHVLALAFAEELLNEMTHHPDTTASIRRHYVFCE
jgi:hypothetical protein